MNQLILAGLFRLKKSRLFWAVMAAVFFLGVLIPVRSFLESRAYHAEALPPLETFLNGHVIFVPIALSVLVALFLGTEHSDGALRNKLIVGRTRREVYLSSLTVSLTASLLITAAYLAGCLGAGIPLLGAPAAVPAGPLLACIGGSLLTEAAVCALLTLVSLICANKSHGVVICILALMGALLLSGYIRAALEQPEYYHGYAMTEEGAVVQTDERIPNINYVTGTKRQVYEFLADFLPTGQMVAYVELAVERLWLPPLYSLLIVFVSTAAGLAVFRRKDLK